MKRAHKYGAKSCLIDGIRFDSQAEGRRFSQLKLLLRAGTIEDLVLQPRFPFVVNGIKVCTYVADFGYREADESVVEDVKGVKTDVYRIKRALMKAIYGIEIREIGA